MEVHHTASSTPGAPHLARRGEMINQARKLLNGCHLLIGDDDAADAKYMLTTLSIVSGADCTIESALSLNKVIAALWVQFRKGIVEEKHGGAPFVVDEHLDLGEEQREKHAALLSTRRDVGHFATADGEDCVIAVWSDEGVPLVRLGCCGVEQGGRKLRDDLSPRCVLRISLARAVRD